MKKDEGRKVRSDKKKPIAPYIADAQRVWIHRIARVCDLPEGDVGLQLISAALGSEDCIVFFSQYFKRDYRFRENILYFGHEEAKSIHSYLVDCPKRARFKVKPSRSMYDKLSEFQIALGIPYLAHATYALLQYALHDISLVRGICPQIRREHFISAAQPASEPERAMPEKAVAVIATRPAKSQSNSNVWSILK